MTQFNVSPAALQQAIDDTQSCHNALVAEKEGLEAFLKNLQAEWYGSASDAWRGTQKEWNDACDEVNGILKALMIALEVAHGNYTRTSLGLEQMWSGG